MLLQISLFVVDRNVRRLPQGRCGCCYAVTMPCFGTTGRLPQGRCGCCCFRESDVVDGTIVAFRKEGVDAAVKSIR